MGTPKPQIYWACAHGKENHENGLSAVRDHMPNAECWQPRSVTVTLLPIYNGWYFLTVTLLLYDATCVLVLMRTFECPEVTSGIGISDSWAMHARSGKIHSKREVRHRCSQNQEDAFFFFWVSESPCSSDSSDKVVCLIFFFERCAPARWGPPEGWEPPGARSRKVDSLKKKWHELLSKCLSFFRMFF